MRDGFGLSGGESRGMWKGYYGEEPFDLRLALLRLIYRLPFLAGAILAGTFLGGGGDYVKNVLLRGENLYSATSVFRVEYRVAEEKDVGMVFINEASWNPYLHSEMFLDLVQSALKEQGGPGIEEQALSEMLRANLASDLRLPSVIVTGSVPEDCVAAAKAVESVLTGEFARQIREIASVSVVDSGDRAQEVIPDVRVGRAFVLSAVVSFFIVLTAALLKEAGDDSIRLPSSLGKRYGLKCAGTLGSRELWENLKYHFGVPGEEDSLWKRKVAVCPVQGELDSREVLEGLWRAWEQQESKTGAGDKAGRAAGGGSGRTEDPVSGQGTEGRQCAWSALPSPLTSPQVCRKLREAQGILLAVEAGSHGGRQVELVLEYLEQQDCQVTAAILWNADEKLIRRYYWGRRSGVTAKGEKG